MLYEDLTGVDLYTVFSSDHVKVALRSLLHIGLDASIFTASFKPKETPDIIHVISEYPTLLLAPLFKLWTRVLIATCHGTYSIAPAHTKLRSLFKLCLGSCDALIAVSNFTRAALIKTYGLEPEKVYVIPNMINLSKFKLGTQREEAREILNLPLNSKIILSVGRLVKRKGYEFSLKAVKELSRDFKNLLYIIVGRGPEEKALRDLAIQLGIANRVKLVGEVPDSTLPLYYMAADIFLMTPVVVGHTFEGFGLVLLEAAAAKLPVVCFQSGGVSEAVMDGVNGFIVRKGDLRSLIDCVAKLLKDEELRVKMGRAGRQLAERFSWDRAVLRFEELYRELVTKRLSRDHKETQSILASRPLI